MKTKQLGNSDLFITPVGFGAWAIGGSGWEFAWGAQDDNASIAAIHRALELGVNWIDTAAVYGTGHSEEVVARALTSWRGRRPYVFTKCGLRWDQQGQTHRILTRASVQRECEESLRRLETDWIDVYQLHAPDPVVPLVASIETLCNMQSEGKIRFVALSNVTVEHIERARKLVPIVSVQNRYSFADREWDHVVDYCERNGIAFIPWFPLGAGTVAGKALERIAKARGVKPNQVALAWLLKRSPTMLPIPGTSSIAHLEENVQAASLQLSEKEYLELTGITELAS